MYVKWSMDSCKANQQSFTVKCVSCWGPYNWLLTCTTIDECYMLVISSSNRFMFAYFICLCCHQTALTMIGMTTCLFAATMLLLGLQKFFHLHNQTQNQPTCLLSSIQIVEIRGQSLPSGPLVMVYLFHFICLFNLWNLLLAICCLG